MPNGPYVSGDLVRRPAAVVSRIGTSSVLMHMAANQKTVLKSCALCCHNPALCRLAHPGCSGSGPLVPKLVAEAFASALCTASDTTAALCLTRAAMQKIGHDLSWICATWLPVETEHWGSKSISNSCNLAHLVPTNTGFWIQRAPYDRDCKQTSFSVSNPTHPTLGAQSWHTVHLSWQLWFRMRIRTPLLLWIVMSCMLDFECAWVCMMINERVHETAMHLYRLSELD